MPAGQPRTPNIMAGRSPLRLHPGWRCQHLAGEGREGLLARPSSERGRGGGGEGAVNEASREDLGECHEQPVPREGGDTSRG